MEKILQEIKEDVCRKSSREIATEIDDILFCLLNGIYISEEQKKRAGERAKALAIILRNRQ